MMQARLIATALFANNFYVANISGRSSQELVEISVWQRQCEGPGLKAPTHSIGFFMGLKPHAEPRDLRGLKPHANP
jgi:hypothetical protein